MPASVVVDERIIAIIADPPEAIPGQPVTFAPVVVSPQGSVDLTQDLSVSWWRCAKEEATVLADEMPCNKSATRILASTSASFIDEVPGDVFGDISVVNGVANAREALQATLGYLRAVGVSVGPSSAAGDFESRRLDAFKHVPVYLPAPLHTFDDRFAGVDVHVNAQGDLTENTNPTLSSVAIKQSESANGEELTTVVQERSYVFSPVYEETTLQPYFSLRVDFAGLPLDDVEALNGISVEEILARLERVQRCEIPVFSWFVTHGRLRRDTTTDHSVITRIYQPQGISCPEPSSGDGGLPDNYYTPPTGDDDDPMPDDGVVHGWVVLRDGRGGTAVRSFDFTVKKAQ